MGSIPGQDGVSRKDEVENKTYDEPVRSTKRDLMGEKVRELVETRKMECESYHLLPIEPMHKAMLKKMITKKEDIRDVNVMPLSTYNRLTDEKLVENNIRLSIASQSHIYPLGIAEDVLVEVLTPQRWRFLILYQAYGNLYATTGRKVHLLEDKQTLSVGVFDEVIWEARGGYTRDLDSFGEETGQDCSFTTKWLQELLIEPGDGVVIF
ncbi:hypothetical protein Tco_0810206 [Tanacetum coccineum]